MKSIQDNRCRAKPLREVVQIPIGVAAVVLLAGLMSCAEPAPPPRVKPEIQGSTSPRPPRRASPVALDVSEARKYLKVIFDGAKGYFERPPMGRRTRPLPPPMFPASVDLTPGRDCSEMKGGACSNVSWDDPTWYGIGMQILELHRFNYAFVSTGEGVNAHFTAFAVARIPGSAHWLVLEWPGTVNAKHRVIGPKQPRTRKVDSLSGIRLSQPQRELADCQKFKFVPKRGKYGQLPGGKKAIPVQGKGMTYCAKLWKKRCTDTQFVNAYPASCRRISGASKP